MEELRKKYKIWKQNRLKLIKLPPPRYDKVYYAGLKMLDEDILELYYKNTNKSRQPRK